MKILLQGWGVQKSDWCVTEGEAAGYSRVYYITSGDVTYSDNHKTEKLKVGSLYAFPSSIPFRITHNPENPLCCLWFHFDFFPASVDRLIEFEVCGALEDLLNALITERKAHRISGGFYNHLEKALYCFISESGRLLDLPETVAQTLLLIRNNCLNSEFSVKALCKQKGYSSEHFIREFKRALNITPYQYVLEIRMSTARTLLLEGNSVSFVSEAVGYTDSKTFSYTFKKKYGISPSQYKKLKPTA